MKKIDSVDKAFGTVVSLAFLVFGVFFVFESLSENNVAEGIWGTSLTWLGMAGVLVYSFKEMKR